MCVRDLIDLWLEENGIVTEFGTARFPNPIQILIPEHTDDYDNRVYLWHLRYRLKGKMESYRIEDPKFFERLEELRDESPLLQP